MALISAALPNAKILAALCRACQSVGHQVRVPFTGVRTIGPRCHTRAIQRERFAMFTTTALQRASGESQHLRAGEVLIRPSLMAQAGFSVRRARKTMTDPAAACQACDHLPAKAPVRSEHDAAKPAEPDWRCCISDPTWATVGVVLRPGDGARSGAASTVAMSVSQHSGAQASCSLMVDHNQYRIGTPTGGPRRPSRTLNPTLMARHAAGEVTNLGRIYSATAILVATMIVGGLTLGNAGEAMPRSPMYASAAP